MFALISTEELDELNQIMVKQLKNRYNDKAKNRKFIVGINRAKMKLFDVQKEDQGYIAESGQKKEEDFFAKEKKQNFREQKKFDSWKI